MKLVIYTLALDAMPYIKHQFDTIKGLRIPWHWHICEGVADSVLDTSWVKKIQPRFSTDGTTEFLNTLLKHPNITIHRKQLWHGKVEMCNAAISKITEPCVLMQIDADEIWTANQLEKIVELFTTNPQVDSMRFYCRYYVGDNIVVTSINTYGNKPGEWHRAWRFQPGMVQEKHEPPILSGCGKNCMSREQTLTHGLIFHHHAYATRKQVEFKEEYYGYAGAAANWDRLQSNTVWPAHLSEFLPWVPKDCVVDKIK